MHHSISMTMIDCLKELKHIFCSLFLTKLLVLLVCDFVKEFHALDVLHDKIQEFLIIVSFKVVDDVWMVKFVKDVDLFPKHIN